jgi:hypothetical protein
LNESAASDQHVTYEVKRSVDRTRIDNLIAMLAGEANASISGAAAD